jgi:hypothetical protein
MIKDVNQQTGYMPDKYLKHERQQVSLKYEMEGKKDRKCTKQRMEDTKK